MKDAISKMIWYPMILELGYNVAALDFACDSPLWNATVYLKGLKSRPVINCSNFSTGVQGAMLSEQTCVAIR